MLKPATLAKYQTTIGIETHVQLKTVTKLFCRCLNDSAATKPNVNICPICMGMPGSLPYLNRQAVELTIQAGLALGAEVSNQTKFDRKHYFYPDLPKGYQISQYDQPLINRGRLLVPFKDGDFTVGIIRAHLEEDAGKSTHPEGQNYSLVDLNRTGTPLLEIVSAPDITSPAQARAYVQELYLTMLYAGVSDVDLFRGNMRFDVNISVRPNQTQELGLRTEVKNLNSFKSVERASQFEVLRQIGEIEKGKSLSQDTRGWDESKGKTYALRSKEGEADYLYFPEPDIPPLVITKAMVKQAKADLPSLPADIRRRLLTTGLKSSAVQTLLLQPRLVDMFVTAAKSATPGQAQRIANWLIRDIKTMLSDSQVTSQSPALKPARLLELAKMVEAGQLSSNGAEQVLKSLVGQDADPKALAAKLDLLQVSDSGELAEIVGQVLSAQPAAVTDYRGGNDRSLQFLVGQVMAASRGKANPQLVTQLIKKQLAR